MARKLGYFNTHTVSHNVIADTLKLGITVHRLTVVQYTDFRIPKTERNFLLHI